MPPVRGLDVMMSDGSHPTHRRANARGAAVSPPPTLDADEFARVLLVHAHPDDETITTGGTIAQLTAAGAQATVLTCTRGEQGEVVPADLQPLLAENSGAAQGDAVAAHREQEIADAMVALGVTDHRWLGSVDARVAGRAPRRYRDSGMVWGSDGPVIPSDLHPDALCAAHPGEVAADIATVIADTRATAVISYNRAGGYGHPDHVAVAAAARHAAAILGVPFWAIDDVVSENEPQLADSPPRRNEGSGESSNALIVDVRPVLQRKLSALRAHRSQLTVTGDVIVMSGGQVNAIGLDEGYRRDDAVVAPKEHAFAAPVSWTELSWRRRILASVFTVGAGAAVGAITTIAHQSEVSVLGVDVPLGLIAGLAVIAALLVGLRLVSEGRAFAGLAAAGILGMIAILSQESAGGSVLVPVEPLAAYWVYAPVAIAFFALAWPNLAQVRRDKLGSTSSSNGSFTP